MRFHSFGNSTSRNPAAFNQYFLSLNRNVYECVYSLCIVLDDIQFWQWQNGSKEKDIDGVGDIVIVVVENDSIPKSQS